MPRSLASFLQRQAHLLIPLLILLPVLWTLLPGGLPNSADGTVHFTRITEIVASWRDGILIPRWSLNLGFGYGVPVFIFGPPLSYWLGAAYKILGFGPEAAYKAMLVTVLFIGATGSYRLGQTLLGVWAGAVAAVAYIYAPNQLFTLFVQGNAPQLLAWSLMAWALWATIQIFRAGRARQQFIYMLALAIAVSGTLISHNVVTLILVPTLAALTLMLWIFTRAHRALWLTIAGGALGGMLSAWFVLPALLETVYASTDAIFAFDYHGSFVPLAELLAWPPRLDAGAINPYIPRTLGLPHVIIALMGLLVLIGWGIGTRWRKVAAPSHQPILWGTAFFMVLYALFCGVMTTAWSTPLWERVSLLEFLQFPARWIGFASFALAWLAAATVGLLPRRAQPFLAATLCLFLIGTALVNLYPDKTPIGTRKMSPYDVVRYEVKSGAIGTTSYGEFNPRWAPRPLAPSPMVEDYMAHQPVDRLKGMLPAGASHRILSVTAHRQRYEITLPAPATLAINLLYFPGWAATVNGTPTDITPQEGTGLILVNLPAGDSVLDLTFGPTPLRRAMGLLSSATWLALILALVILQMRRARTRVDTTQPAPSDEVSGTGYITLGTAICLALVLQSAGADWFQLKSPPDQALAAPVARHEDIDGRFRLLGQNVLQTTIRAGEMLPVVAYWRALDDMDTNYAVVLQLENSADGQILVETEQSHPNNIPTSGWATGLYVRNAWQLPIPTDALPVQNTLRVGFRDPDSGNMLPTSGGTSTGDTMISLGQLWVLPPVEPKPPAGSRVRFGDAIELVGTRIDGTTLTLYWRANSPVSDEYTIFVHLLDANGTMVGQVDGLPFANRYPTWAWRPEQIIEDVRDLAAPEFDGEFDIAQIQAIAVGLYLPATGERLTALDTQGNQLPNNAQIIEWIGK